MVIYLLIDCNKYNIVMNTIPDIKKRLEDFGVKPSMQRIAIMDFLMKNPIHPTVDIVFQSLNPSIPTLSKTTVYNTLKLLEEHGVIQSITIDEKNIRYDADISFHAHFKCKRCNVIYDLRVKDLNNLLVGNQKNLLISQCQLYFQGYCEKCAEKLN